MFSSCFKISLQKKYNSNNVIILPVAINGVIYIIEILQNMPTVFNKPRGNPYNMKRKKAVVDMLISDNMKGGRIS